MPSSSRAVEEQPKRIARRPSLQAACSQTRNSFRHVTCSQLLTIVGRATGGVQAPAPHTCALRCSVRIAWIVLLVACRRDASPELAGLDLAQATTRLHALATSCAGLTRALDALAASDFADRALLELVDDTVDAARASCPAPELAGTTPVHQLARAHLVNDHPGEALAVLTATTAAIHLRRADLLDRANRPAEALAELAAAAPLDDAGRTQQRLLAVSVAARAGNTREVAHAIAIAPLVERPALAFRAAFDAPPDRADAFVAAAEEPELANAIADRIAIQRGPAAPVAARERAAVLGPARAEYHHALAIALAAADRLDDALAAWDRAAALAPAQPAFQLAPIRALVKAGQVARARTRAAALATSAREIDALLVASQAAAEAGNHASAVELARAARAKRPGDGRLVFEVAARLADARERAAAADLYAELLVCGAHGHAWHRHEVAAKLVELGPAAITALAGNRACDPPEPADLAGYVDAIRAKLR